MKGHKHISVIYGILLVIIVAFCIGGFIFIPVDIYTVYGNSSVELEPSDIIILNEDVREFHFRDIDWEKYGTCLQFVSSHNEITVEADGNIIFERKSVKTIWGITTGFIRDFIDIPSNTKEVIVTATACYPQVRNVSIVFYQGIGTEMLRDLLREESLDMIISMLNVCLGLILIGYGSISRKRTSIGSAMVYLGIFTVLLGVWAIIENVIVAILFKNQAACSYVSYTMLAMVGLPFVMFVRCYLQTDDRFHYRILLASNVINIIIQNIFQILGIADMKQMLSITHIVMVMSVLYLPFSLIRMLRQRMITHRFWVTVCSLVSMCPPLAYSLFMYYHGSHNVNGYGNVFVFVFIMIFAVDVTTSIMRDVDAGKKAAIYKELAEKDMLTGCYNRNAYRNDTDEWDNPQGVIIVTCDLNNLKQCNDTLGHAYGDMYITDSANILKKVFERYGKVYRIGGDEFCIIIPNNKKCNIRKLLVELEDEERIYNNSSEVIRLEIACGYAEFEPKTDKTIEDIRVRADILMYENKKEIKRLRIV